MIYVNEINQEMICCPLCGANSFNNPCKHVVAMFLEQAFDGEGCIYLAPDVREKFFPNLPEGFPIKYGDSEKLKRTARLFCRYKKGSKTFMLSFREYEPRTYEWPIIRAIYRADVEDQDV